MIPPEIEAGPADWDSRVLCSDESCIGVLGPDGRCSVCGLQGAAPGERAVVSRSAELDDEESSEAKTEAKAEARDELDAGVDSGDAFAERELCPDETCIGVLDDAGVCKVCGAKKS